MATTPAPAADETGQGQTTSWREPRPDIRITTKVKAKLLKDDLLTRKDIEVSIRGAIVQLAGW